MTRLDYLFKHYENILGWYKQSEEKAKFLVTLNTLAVGVVNGLVFIGADKVSAARPIYNTPIWLLLGLSGVALVASYLLVLSAIWPRHRSRDADLKPSEKLWFFGDVDSLAREDYQAMVAELDEQDLVATMTAQNHILSKNVWIKHEALNRAIAFSIAAYILVFGLGVAYAVAVANIPVSPPAVPGV